MLGRPPSARVCAATTDFLLANLTTLTDAALHPRLLNSTMCSRLFIEKCFAILSFEGFQALSASLLYPPHLFIHLSSLYFSFVYDDFATRFLGGVGVNRIRLLLTPGYRVVPNQLIEKLVLSIVMIIGGHFHIAGPFKVNKT